MKTQDILEVKRQLKAREDLEESLYKKEEIIAENAAEMINKWDSKENYEIYFYQSKVDKIIALQKMNPNRVIRYLDKGHLFGMSVTDLDILIDYYQA